MIRAWMYRGGRELYDSREHALNHVGEGEPVEVVIHEASELALTDEEHRIISCIRRNEAHGELQGLFCQTVVEYLLSLIACIERLTGGPQR